MDSASLASSMSYCKRKKVGAVIVKNKRILVNSWNGSVESEDNCCEQTILKDMVYCKYCEDKSPIDDYYGLTEDNINEYDCINCTKTKSLSIIIIKELKTIDTIVHAEKNAIAYAAKEGIKTKGCSLYVTMSPCVPCAILMKQSGIKKVFYKEEYRDTKGIDFLESVGIKVKRIK